MAYENYTPIGVRRTASGTLLTITNASLDPAGETIADGGGASILPTVVGNMRMAPKGSFESYGISEHYDVWGDVCDISGSNTLELIFAKRLYGAALSAATMHALKITTGVIALRSITAPMGGLAKIAYDFAAAATGSCPYTNASATVTTPTTALAQGVKLGAVTWTPTVGNAVTLNAVDLSLDTGYELEHDWNSAAIWPQMCYAKKSSGYVVTIKAHDLSTWPATSPGGGTIEFTLLDIGDGSTVLTGSLAGMMVPTGGGANYLDTTETGMKITCASSDGEASPLSFT